MDLTPGPVVSVRAAGPVAEVCPSRRPGTFPAARRVFVGGRTIFCEGLVMGNAPGGQPRPQSDPVRVEHRDERGHVRPLTVGGPWEGFVAMAMLWAVPVVGFVLVMLLGGPHA